jgi:hypothetical protein
MGLALLANSLATGGALVAHPGVRRISEHTSIRSFPWWRARRLGCAVVRRAGQTVVPSRRGRANLMFGEPAVAWSQHARSGLPQAFGEVVATFGLVATIIGCARHRPDAVPFAVAAYIVGAYWFTVSTSFANPAVTVARALTDTFTGIRPQDVPLFVAAQLAGGRLGRALPLVAPTGPGGAGARGGVATRLDWEILRWRSTTFSFCAPATRPQHHGRGAAELLGQGRFQAFSAGATKGRCIHWRSYARAKPPANGPAQQSWSEFSRRMRHALCVHRLRQRPRSVSGVAGRP